MPYNAPLRPTARPAFLLASASASTFASVERVATRAAAERPCVLRHLLTPALVPRIHVTGWNPGLNKVAMTKAYQRELGVGLAAAKGMTDALLDGERVEFEVETPERAETFAAELTALGAVVEVTNNRVP